MQRITEVKCNRTDSKFMYLVREGTEVLSCNTGYSTFADAITALMQDPIVDLTTVLDCKVISNYPEDKIVKFQIFNSDATGWHWKLLVGGEAWAERGGFNSQQAAEDAATIFQEDTTNLFNRIGVALGAAEFEVV